jgi:hypothetical protein
MIAALLAGPSRAWRRAQKENNPVYTATSEANVNPFSETTVVA